MRNQILAMVDQLGPLNHNPQILALKNIQFFLWQSCQLHLVDPQNLVLLDD